MSLLLHWGLLRVSARLGRLLPHVFTQLPPQAEVVNRGMGPYWADWGNGEPWPRRRVLELNPCLQLGHRGCRGQCVPRFLLPAGAALPRSGPHPAPIWHPQPPGPCPSGQPRACVPASTLAKRIHPGNPSTLPNSSLFPPVAMATRDLTEFLGALPAFFGGNKAN